MSNEQDAANAQGMVKTMIDVLLKSPHFTGDENAAELLVYQMIMAVSTGPAPTITPRETH